MKNNVTVFSFFLLCFWVTSCSKEENLVKDSDRGSSCNFTLDYKGITVLVKDGRLVFNSVEEASFMELEAVKSPEEFLQWIKSIPGFMSSEDAYLSINEDTYLSTGHNLQVFEGCAYLDDEVLMPVVDDPAWRHLANANGIFQVGYTVYKISRDKVFSIHESSYAKGGFNHSEDMAYIPIKRNILSQWEGEVEFRVTVVDCETEYTNGEGKPRQLKGRIREQRALFSDNVNCIADTRVFRGIFRQRANRLEQRGCLTVNGNYDVCFSVDQDGNNTSIIERIFFSGDNARINLFQGNSVTHRAIDGPTVICVTAP